jgi:transcriptional regulator with XRE-family HTH domain
MAARSGGFGREWFSGRPERKLTMKRDKQLLNDESIEPLNQLKETPDPSERHGPKGDRQMNKVVGLRIRGLRTHRGWTFAKMSENTGVARSTLSKLEGGQMSPTIGLLQKIACGLEVNITDLLGEGTEFFEHDGRVHEVLCGELSNKKIVPFRTTVPAQSQKEIQRWYHHDGEEFIYVLTGTIVMHSKLYAAVELSAGDSVYFDANLDHVVVNSTKENATVLWMVSN